jgi:very-short-patch-repair endonuclease
VYEDKTIGIKIAVFLDGGIHDTASIRQKDKIVTLALEASGWKVIRIRNEELEDPQLVEFYRLSIAKTLNIV